MTDGGVDRSVECTGNINAMVSPFECVHDVCVLRILYQIFAIGQILILKVSFNSM